VPFVAPNYVRVTEHMFDFRLCSTKVHTHPTNHTHAHVHTHIINCFISTKQSKGRSSLHTVITCKIQPTKVHTFLRNISDKPTAKTMFVGPCIVIYFYSKTNQMHTISNLFYFDNNTLHVSDGLSVHHQESTTVHTASGICHTVPSRSR